jgi:hypothetical protein
VKGIYEDKRKYEGMKWNEEQEQEAMQQLLEEEMPYMKGMNIPVLQTEQPGSWHQGYFSIPQVPINSERYYTDDYNIGQRPYYHPGNLLDQSTDSLQWWEVPQTQLWAPEYRQNTPFLRDQQSPINQELRNKQLLLKSNKESLHLQERLPDLTDNPSSESGQGKINATMEKQTRLNVVKAKLLQRYQLEAAEKRQRARQMSLSVVPKDTNSSSGSDHQDQLNTSFPNMEKRKVSDIIGATVQMKFENPVSRNNTIADVSRKITTDENATGPTRSNIMTVLLDSRPTSDKAKHLPSEAEMPVNSEQIPEEMEAKERYSILDTGLEVFGSTSTDEPLGIETKSTGNLNDGLELDGKTSHEDEGIAYGLEGRSSNQKTTISYEMSSYWGEIVAYTESSTPRWNSNPQNKSFQERNINGNLIRYPEKAVTYVVERTEVPDVLNDTSHNINQSTESTSTSDIRSKEESSQIALKIDSAHVPRANNISEGEFISKHQPIYKDNGARNIASENKETSTIMASADTSDMKRTPMKIKSVTDVSAQENITNYKQLASIPEPEFRTQDVSEFQNNGTDSPATRITDIDFTDSINYVTGEGKMTPSDASALNASQEKNSSGSLFTSKPAASVTTKILAQQRDTITLSHVSDTQVTSDDIIINHAATILPERNTMRSVSWNSSSSNDRNENMLSNSTTSNREISTKNKSNDTNSNDSQNYKEDIDKREDSQIPFNSNNPSSVYIASSKDFMYDPSSNNASEISFKNTEIGRGSKSPTMTETQATTAFNAREASNGTSDISDEISVISSNDGSSKTEEALNVPKSLGDFKISHRMRSAAEEQSRIRGITAAQVSNTSSSTAYTSPTNNYVSNSNKNQAELLGMGRNQKNRSSFSGHQINLEGGFPQAPNNEQQTGYSQDGSIPNIKMNRTSVLPQFKIIPSSLQIAPAHQPLRVLPEDMRFLVYPNGVLPTRIPQYTENERGPGQFAGMFPSSYIYPIPLPAAYSLRSNPYIYSNNPLKNIYHATGIPAQRISKPAENNINEQKIEGKLPFIVVLEQH